MLSGLMPRINGIVFVVARLINAPVMGDVAKLFGAPADLFFVESILLKADRYFLDINRGIKNASRYEKSPNSPELSCSRSFAGCLDL